MACIARSFEQQRAIYGITPMINGTTGSGHPSTLFSTLSPLPAPPPLLFSAYSSLSFPRMSDRLRLSRPPPTCYQPLAHLGPNGSGASDLVVHEPADELYGYRGKKVYNVKAARCPCRPYLIHSSVRLSVRSSLHPVFPI